MKAELKFSLPEEKDEFTLATRGIDLWGVLCDYDQWLRNELKYQDAGDETQRARDTLYNFMEQHNISLDMVE